MPLEVLFAPAPFDPHDARLLTQFEQVVLDALRSKERAVTGGAVHVRFQLWEGDEGPRYVCKVECASASSVHLEEPPWRWWSGLVETPLELGQQLRDALLTCERRRRRCQAPLPSAERSTAAGELLVF
jgi:hypothetical protein